MKTYAGRIPLALALVSLTAEATPACKGEDPKHTDLKILLPTGYSQNQLRAWLDPVKNQTGITLGLVLVPENRDDLTEAKLINLIQTVQSILPKAELRSVTPEEIESLVAWRIRSLPVFAAAHGRRIHVWEGHGNWKEILICDRK